MSIRCIYLIVLLLFRLDISMRFSLFFSLQPHCSQCQYRGRDNLSKRLQQPLHLLALLNGLMLTFQKFAFHPSIETIQVTQMLPVTMKLFPIMFVTKFNLFI